MKSARIKFEGLFKIDRTRISFTSKIGLLSAAKICAPMVSAFDQTMAEEYAEKLTRPRLKKITITILF